MKTRDALGDRMKRYEQQTTELRLMGQTPIMERLDGRVVHTLTRSFDRPFDEALSKSMRETTIRLVEEFQADLGYTQSDEITLDPKNLGTFIKWIHGDILKEESDTLAVSDIDPTLIGKPVAERAKNWFFKQWNARREV